MARPVLRGGDAARARLALLDADRATDTAALLERAGVRGAQRCVDLGCGLGAVTVELATRVAPDGDVLGVGEDEAELDLARQAASDRGAANARFAVGDLAEWDEPAGYDVVYSRCTLEAVQDPRGLLGRMWAAVRPGGALVVESADHDGWCGHPTNAGLNFFQRSVGEVQRRRGGDPTFGRKLVQCCAELGIDAPALRVVQSVHAAGPEKALACATLELAGDAIADEDVAPPEAVAEALASLRRFTDDPRTLICGPRVFQLLARRPAAP